MNKLSKRAISILVIATFLLSMIPIMPAIAAPITIDEPTSEDYIWTEDSGLDVVYSPVEARFGSYSAFAPRGAGNPGLEISWSTDGDFAVRLGDLDTLTYWSMLINNLAVNPQDAIIVLAIDVDGNGVYTHGSGGDDYLFGEPFYFETGDGSGYTPAYDIWSEIDALDEDFLFWDRAADARNSSALKNLQWYIDNIDSGNVSDPRTIALVTDLSQDNVDITADSMVIGIYLEAGGLTLGGAPDDYNEVYIDDLTVNDVVFPIEPVNVVYVGDEITVSGTGVTSGVVVSIYWDVVTTVGLISTTPANPDGSYDAEFDIPDTIAGPHWIWVKDPNTGLTARSGIMYVKPVVEVSPTSGVIDDPITLTGGGFAPDTTVTVIFNDVDLLTVDTDAWGAFTTSFDVPELGDLGYDVDAWDGNGYTATDVFTVGPALTFDEVSGPVGSVVSVSGRGFSEVGDTEVDTVTLGGTACEVLDGPILIDTDGTFELEFIVPVVTEVDDYDVVISDNETLSSTLEYEVDGLSEIVISPTYGAPGATITITGSNFTQISGTEVAVVLGGDTLVTATTDGNGAFSDTFISPAVAFLTYDVTATDEYFIDATDSFKVGLIALIVNPTSGEAGTKIAITGIGFEPSGNYNLSFGSKLYEDYTDGVGSTGVSGTGAITDNFYIPNVAPGVYSLTIVDQAENELVTQFTVTESSTASLDPAVAPNNYNISISGYNFADIADGALDFVIYNSTYELDIDVLQDPTPSAAVTNDDGNFTAYWMVPTVDSEDLALGDYTINITDSEDLLVQLDFSVVAARVQVTPRKALFDRGNQISFDISNDFDLPESYIEIYSPDDTLYWITEDFTGVWVLIDDLYTVPYYRQTANQNPMELASDAPLGTWTYFFYDIDDEELMNGTFAVGASTAAQVDALLEDVRSDISGLAEDLAGVTDDMADDLNALSGEIAGVASNLANLADDIVSDLAGDIADATDAGNAALNAVEDLADSMTDLGNAVSDIADIASDSAVASQSAADAANDAVQAAQDAKDSASGLTTLVYGAIGASLIAALAAIVSLMQISKRIAG